MKLKKPTIKLHPSKTQVKHVVNKVQKQSKQKLKLLKPIKFKRLIIGSALILLVVVGLSFIPLKHTGFKNVSLDYVSQNTSDSTIELGNTKISQQGVKGSGVEKYTYKKSFVEYIFGARVPETQVALHTVKQPVNEVIANGTLRYQYMYCSNGSYRSYTDEQMKDPSTGMTHKSPDYCAQNNEGTETQLANMPPGSKTTNTSSTTACTQTTIPYGITYQDDSSLPAGQTQTIGGMIGIQLTNCNGKTTTIPPTNATEFVGTGTSSSAPTPAQPPASTSQGNEQAYQQCMQSIQSQVSAAGGLGGSWQQEAEQVCNHYL
jgi:hypothetical protein